MNILKTLQNKISLYKRKKKDIVHIHNGITQPLKKNEIMPFAATCMDLESVILSEVNQTEKEDYHMVPLICGS